MSNKATDSLSQAANVAAEQIAPKSVIDLAIEKLSEALLGHQQATSEAIDVAESAARTFRASRSTGSMPAVAVPSESGIHAVDPKPVTKPSTPHAIARAAEHRAVESRAVESVLNFSDITGAFQAIRNGTK